MPKEKKQDIKVTKTQTTKKISKKDNTTSNKNSKTIKKIVNSLAPKKKVGSKKRSCIF